MFTYAKTGGDRMLEKLLIFTAGLAIFISGMVACLYESHLVISVVLLVVDVLIVFGSRTIDRKFGVGVWI